MFVMGGLVASACVGDQTADSIETAEVVRSGNVSNSIVVKSSNLCLVGVAAGTGGIIQDGCLSHQTRWWKIVESDIDPGFFWIEQEVNGSRHCLDVPGGSTSSGLALQTFSCHRRDSQLFKLTRTGAGEWKIQPKTGVAANLCLDVAFGDAVAGRVLQQFTCKTTNVDNQRFLAVPQLQPPQFVDCDNDDEDDFLRVVSSDGSFTMFPEGIRNFNARSFRYGCTDSSAPDSFSCPAGTSLIEINWTYDDEFRVKCALQ
jgi:hypothetical protein